jgi:hypothetical protein
MSKVCQINYNKESAALFVQLANNMANPDLVAGPPSWDSSTGQIRQLYGMCPSTSGAVCVFTPVGMHWHVQYEDQEESAVLALNEIPGWFTGDY